MMKKLQRSMRTRRKSSMQSTPSRHVVAPNTVPTLSSAPDQVESCRLPPRFHAVDCGHIGEHAAPVHERRFCSFHFPLLCGQLNKRLASQCLIESKTLILSCTPPSYGATLGRHRNRCYVNKRMLQLPIELFSSLQEVLADSCRPNHGFEHHKRPCVKSSSYQFRPMFASLLDLFRRGHLSKICLAPTHPGNATQQQLGHLPFVLKLHSRSAAFHWSHILALPECLQDQHGRNGSSSEMRSHQCVSDREPGREQPDHCGSNY